MCQLLGINSTEAADVSESFSSFTQRGAQTNPHGWGLSYYDESRKLQTYVEASNACVCPIAKSFCLKESVKTTNMLAHIRYATQGEVCLQNVHPFSREIWGIHVCFAHNGEIPQYYGSRDTPMFENGLYRPLGNTDSEAFFCDLLNYLRKTFTKRPSKASLYKAIHLFCTDVASRHEYLILNFLLSFGENVVLAYSWPGRRPGGTVWNGLWYLVRNNYSTERNSLDSAAAIISTKPLTEGIDQWNELERNELILFERGVPYSFSCNPPVKNIKLLNGPLESTDLTIYQQTTQHIMLGPAVSLENADASPNAQ